MKYMFLIYSPESSWTEVERQACMIESMGICDQLASLGKFITASPLEYVPTAKTVRVRNGQSLITTGPFAETTEQLGGFYLLDLENLDEAIAVASRLPPAKKGTVEIRPIIELDGLPAMKLQLIHEHNSSLKPYMFLSYDDEQYWQNAEPKVFQAAVSEAVALTHELDALGKYISAAPLHPTSTATSVRIRNGQRLITDGPFAETSEVLGGYYLILAKDQDEAIKFAARHSGARVGSVEVRPLFDVPTISSTSQLMNDTLSESFQMKWTIAASQGDVIKALTQRIKDWWTIDIKGQTTNIDDEFEVSFGKTFKVFKVEELTSNHLVWRCMDSYIAAPGLQKTSEWKGTSIHWSINVIEGATQLDLIHEGLVPEFECYTICCQGWAHFGNSLVSLLEKNSGTPFAG